MFFKVRVRECTAAYRCNVLTHECDKLIFRQLTRDSMMSCSLQVNCMHSEFTMIAKV